VRRAGGPLLIDERAVPGKDRVRLGNRRDLLECFPTQLLTNLGQGVTVAIAQLQAARDLLAEDAVLCGEVCIAEPEFFVHRFAERPQQFLPIHTAFHLCLDELP
jgi:hypothetical protein